MSVVCISPVTVSQHGMGVRDGGERRARQKRHRSVSVGPDLDFDRHLFSCWGYLGLVSGYKRLSGCRTLDQGSGG